MRKFSPQIYALLTGIMLSIPWLVKGSGILLLFAWVPLLFAEKDLAGSKKSLVVWLTGFLTFLVWNLTTTWWLYSVSESMYTKLFASVMPIVLNSLLMSIPWLLFHHSRKKFGNKIGYAGLVCYWISFEYIHLHWELAWPWLTLGNGFSNNIHIVQWYEYTGVLGGSMWVLVANIVLLKFFETIFDKEQKSYRLKRIFVSLVILLLPVVVSLLIFYSYSEKPNPVNVVVVQPNIDPYNEKYEIRNHMQNLQKMLDLVSLKADSTTDYFVCPETALVTGIWENDLQTDRSVKTIREYIKPYPKLKCVVGVSTYRMYEAFETPPASARQYGKKGKLWYDAYNTGMQLDHSQEIQLYHKSILVTGVEKMPYPKVFRFLEALALDLGGIVGTLGTQEEPGIFKSDNDSMKVAPVICYESVFGEYVTDYVKKGAQLIFVITNDGWWGNTPGHIQHLGFSRLRAIETRRAIARSANTGISCFINQLGEISQATEWWTPAVIKTTLNANKQLTFYVKYGDYIGFIFSFCSVMLQLGLIVQKFRKLL